MLDEISWSHTHTLTLTHTYTHYLSPGFKPSTGPKLEQLSLILLPLWGGIHPNFIHFLSSFSTLLTTTANKTRLYKNKLLA